MSVYASASADEAGNQIASNRGWSDFSRFVESLPDCPCLHHLVTHGWEEDLDELASELGQVNYPSKDLQEIGQLLLESLPTAVGMVIVTNGLAPA